MIRGHDRDAVTLVEVLVVTAIVAVLLALSAAAVQQVRSAAVRTQCLNNLHQVGLALHQYHDAHNTFPPGWSRDIDPRHPSMSWHTRLLPYLEQQAVWDQSLSAYDQTPNFAQSPPHPIARVMPVFACPSDGRTLSVARVEQLTVGLTAYLGVQGVNQYRRDGLLFVDSRVRSGDVRDGLSNTLAVGERPPSADLKFGWWYAGAGAGGEGTADLVLGVRARNDSAHACPAGPYVFGPGQVQNQCDMFHFWSLHSGGAHFLFCDGSVRFLTYAVEPRLAALATRAGGESTGGFE